MSPHPKRPYEKELPVLRRIQQRLEERRRQLEALLAYDRKHDRLAPVTAALTREDVKELEQEIGALAEVIRKLEATFEGGD